MKVQVLSTHIFFLFFLDVSLLEIRIYKKKGSFWGKERLRSVTFEEFSQ